MARPTEPLNFEQGAALLAKDRCEKQVKKLIKKPKQRLRFVNQSMFEKEATKHWQMSYDPFSADKVLQIYGYKIPHSFCMRQQAFEEQRVVLEKYSFPRPIITPEVILDQLKQDAKNFCNRDYYV